MSSFPNSWSIPWRLFLLVGLFASLVFVLNMYATAIPLCPICGADDGHYIFQAIDVYAGQWLGAYDNMTLIKGPGFPFFIALAKISHLPFSVFLAAVEAASFVLMSWVVGRFTRSPGLALSLLLVLLAFPWLWIAPVTRIIRDGLYVALLFGCFALLLLAFWTNMRGRWLISILAGLLLGWAWITREENPWLAPPLLALIAMAVFIHWRMRWSLRSLAIGVICAAVSAATVPTTVASINYIKYGGFLVADFYEANFRRAVRALYAVETGTRDRHIPISQSSREAVYAISPAFAELRPLLDAKDAPLVGWQQAGCTFYGGRACGDYAIPWFTWAFRDAVGALNYYRNVPTASAFYGKIADEIEQACASGRLTCRFSPLAEMPPPVSGNFALTLAAAWRISTLISLADWVPDTNPRSSGPRDKIRIAWNFLNRPLVAANKDPQASDVDLESREADLRAVAVVVRDGTMAVFHLAWPVLCVLWLLLLPVATWSAWRRRDPDWPLILSWFFAIVVVSRVGFLSVISGFIQPVIVLDYLSAAAYFLVAAVITGLYSSFGLISQRYFYRRLIQRREPQPLPSSAPARNRGPWH